MAIFNDITKVKELESMSSKVQSMFFSSIAHELRTPLNSIIPLSKLVKDLLPSTEGSGGLASRYVEIIINSSLHLSNIIEDALDISRINNNVFDITLEYFPIDEVIQEVCQIMNFQIEAKGLKLELIIHSSLPKIIKSD